MSTARTPAGSPRPALRSTEAPVHLLTQLTYLHRLGLIDARQLLAHAAMICDRTAYPSRLVHLNSRCTRDSPAKAVKPVRTVKHLEAATWGAPGGRGREEPRVCVSCQHLAARDLDSESLLGPFFALPAHVSWSARADRVLANRYPARRDWAATHRGAARFLLADPPPAIDVAEISSTDASAVQVLLDRIERQVAALHSYRPSLRLHFKGLRARDTLRPETGDETSWILTSKDVFPTNPASDAWAFSYCEALATAGHAVEGPYPILGGDWWAMRVPQSLAEARTDGFATTFEQVCGRGDATVEEFEIALHLADQTPGTFQDVLTAVMATNV